MKIGFIGNGNMGSAIIGGIVKSGVAKPYDILVSDINIAGLEKIKEEFGVNTVSDNKKAAECDIVFLCVKPNVILSVIDEIKDTVIKNTVVSIAAGKSIDALSNAFGKEVKLIRIMPNTPALVGEGMSAISANEKVTEAEKEKVIEIFNSFGKCEEVSESLMDTVTAVSGSSPAYVFMFIEAMADAAVVGGMTRDKAYIFAAQAVLGSAKMVLDTKKHPGVLKDMVCSPAGTTIEAVSVLEEKGMRDAVISAMKVCMEKSKEMGKN